MKRSIITGVGSYLPSRIVTNDDLAQTIDTSDDWIRERTGIRERRIAAEGELTSDLGAAAAREALRRAGRQPQTVDLVIVATSTPDNTFPAVATAIQTKLGIGPAIAFDVQAVCAGFAYAVTTADNFLKSGQVQTALVIGSETFSRILDWSDRSTCVLFGDGAGAVVLEASEQMGTTLDRGILSNHLAADGKYYNDLYVDGGPSQGGDIGFVKMNGREVFKHAVIQLAESSLRVLDAIGTGIDALDWFIPHQANRRIIDAVAKRLQLPKERIVCTVERHANTSAASIPLALDQAYSDGRLRQRDLIVMSAMGGGFAWGASALRW